MPKRKTETTLKGKEKKQRGEKKDTNEEAKHLLLANTWKEGMDPSSWWMSGKCCFFSVFMLNRLIINVERRKIGRASSVLGRVSFLLETRQPVSLSQVFY